MAFARGGRAERGGRAFVMNQTILCFIKSVERQKIVHNPVDNFA